MIYKITTILSILLMIVGLLLYLFFGHYHGDKIEYADIYYFTGIVMILLGIFILYLNYRSMFSKKNKKIKHNINDLKVNGKKIKVNLMNCEIKSNSENIEIDIDPQKVKGYDQLIGKVRDSKYIESHRSVLVYSSLEEGNVFYSEILPISNISLQFLLEAQKETFIYVDKKDNENYYFDVEFLK